MLNRRQFIAGAGVSALYLAMGSSFAASAKSPNLVIVFPDQMQYFAMGFLGEIKVKTPNLDKFAAQGLLLTEAASNYPVCSPFRAMLMTGQYPFSNKVTSNCTSKMVKYDCELQTKSICWSDLLKQNGYSLGYIGKWHLDMPRPPYINCGNNKGDLKWNEWCSPERRHGFDFWNAYGTYDNHLNPMYWKTDAKRDGFYYAKEYGPKHEADIAVEYIKNTDGKYRKKDAPFAMVVSMNPPHTGYNLVPDKYKMMYKDMPMEKLVSRPDIPPEGDHNGKNYRNDIKNYLAQITAVDEQFGRIMDALKVNGLENDTIVLFTSDHGNCLGIHHQGTKNNPYEESMRIPMILRWPGKIKAGKDDLLVSVPDIYPTLLDLLGLKSAVPSEVEGISLAETIISGKGPRPSSQLYMRVDPANPKGGPRGVRTHEYKLVIGSVAEKDDESTVAGNIMLFDLKNDPYEMSNIANKKPDIISRLVKEELVPWLEKAKDPWLENVKKMGLVKE